MKKIIIALAVFVAILLVVPFIGNKIVQDEIETNLDMLASYGAVTKERTSNNLYFKTKDHFEVYVEDGAKFITLINKYSASQLPVTTAELFEGALVGVDLEYWNFPINDSLAVSVYPLEIPSEIQASITEDSPEVGLFLQNFLKNKGIFYHLNFNIARGGFDGYLKDITETFILENGAKISMDILGVNYKGEGTLLAPTKIDSSLDRLSFKVKKDEDNVAFDMSNITTESTYTSDTTYQSGVKAKTMHFKLSDSGENYLFDSKDFTMSVGTDTTSQKASGNLTTTLKELDLRFGNEMIKIKDFNHALYISELDKKSYQALFELIEKAKSDIDNIDAVALEENILELLSKGAVVDLKDFSIASVTFDGKDLKGLSLSAKFTIKPNQAKAHSLNEVMDIVQQNVSVDAKLKLSKEIFSYITTQAPLAALAAGYAEDTGDSYLFELKFGNDNFTINGKPL